MKRPLTVPEAEKNSGSWQLPVGALAAVILFLGTGTLAFALAEDGWTAIDSLYPLSSHYSLPLSLTFVHSHALILLYFTSVPLPHASLWPLPFIRSYFSVVTFTTVGYGDLVPRTLGGRIFNSIYILVGVAGVASALGWLGSYLVSRQASLIETSTGVQFDEPSLWSQLRKFILALVAFFTVVVGGMIVFLATKTVHGGFDAFYNALVTCTTVGYGDFAPETQGMRLFTSLYILVGTVATSISLGTFADIFVRRRQRENARKLLSRTLSQSYLQELDFEKTGEVTELEFLVSSLLRLELVAPEDITVIRQRFAELDIDNNQVLDSHDYVL